LFIFSLCSLGLQSTALKSHMANTVLLGRSQPRQHPAVQQSLYCTDSQNESGHVVSCLDNGRSKLGFLLKECRCNTHRAVLSKGCSNPGIFHILGSWKEKHKNFNALYKSSALHKIHKYSGHLFLREYPQKSVQD